MQIILVELYSVALIIVSVNTLGNGPESFRNQSFTHAGNVKNFFEAAV